jgi:hypothetical protein
MKKTVIEISEKMKIKIQTDSETIKTLSDYVAKFMLITSDFENQEKKLLQKIDCNSIKFYIVSYYVKIIFYLSFGTGAKKIQ